MSFKDTIAEDLNIFFNDLSDEHLINGKQYQVIVDNDRLKHRSKVEYEGIIVGDILYFAKAADFEKIPKVDDIQQFDKIPCMVFDIREDTGLLEVILKKNVS